MTTGMTGTRITFYGFGAFVGSLTGPTQCAWWPDDPATLNWALSALIPTDLSMTPTWARTAKRSWSDIQVDDHRQDGGRTTVGPRFPQGTMVGGIWLSETYWKSLGANQPARPTSRDGHDYEFTTILYWDPALPGRRFHGVHAKLGPSHGPLTRVEFFDIGRSKVPGERTRGPFWLDLAQVAHPKDAGATEVDASNPEGALFLDSSTLVTLGGGSGGPKIPAGWGR